MNPVRRNQLSSVPSSILKQQLPEFCQLVNVQKQSARPVTVAKRIHLPGRQVNTERRKQSRHQIVDEVAAGPPLHKHAGQIRTGVIVQKCRIRVTDPGLRKRQLHPVGLGIKWPVSAHQEGFFLAETHRQKVPDSSLLQMRADKVRKIFLKGIRQLLIQRQKPLPLRNPDRHRRKALADRVDITAPRGIPQLPCDLLSMLLNHNTQYVILFCLPAKTTQIDDAHIHSPSAIRQTPAADFMSGTVYAISGRSDRRSSGYPACSGFPDLPKNQGCDNDAG